MEEEGKTVEEKPKQERLLGKKKIRKLEKLLKTLKKLH